METLSLLIVEDSKAQRDVMAEMAHAAGVRDVSLAENGRAALAAIEAREEPFHLLICDLEMPDVDGLDLIQLLAARKVRSSIAVVSSREYSLISAVELMGRSRGLDMVAGIRKPLRLSQLREVLSQVKRRNGVFEPVREDQSEPDIDADTLRRAIDAHRYALYFQPQIDFATNRLAGLEALLRLPIGDGRIALPGRFIPQCEEWGLINDLTFEVIRIAIKQIADWRSAGLQPLVSINLSAKSFETDVFSRQVMDILQRSRMSPKHLKFEVTETALVKDVGKALAMLSRLRLLGFGLSIDDYGTGYSSVKQLSQMPFTELKLDRSLVDGIAAKPHLQAIYESTQSMCTKLGLSLVAEGIEQPADWDFLRDQGCPVGQGFYYARPMPPDALLDWWHMGVPPVGTPG